MRQFIRPEFLKVGFGGTYNVVKAVSEYALPRPDRPRVGLEPVS